MKKELCKLLNERYDRMKGIITNFMNYRCLLRELVSRDFKLKYRRSMLGYLWSLLNPLFTMLIMTAVFSNVFRFSIENYPVYYLLGSTIYAFYSEATNSAMTAIFGNAELIKKVYVPKYIFPLAKTSFSFVNMLCSLGAVIVVMLISGVLPTKTIILVPVLFFYTFLISLGVGLLLSVATVYFRDLLHLYGVLLTAQMYLTPIFYPVDILPEGVLAIVKCNPLYYLVNYFREIVLYGVWPTLEENLICLGFGVLFVLIGIVVFKKHQKNFILYI